MLYHFSAPPNRLQAGLLSAAAAHRDKQDARLADRIAVCARHNGSSPGNVGDVGPVRHAKIM
jgi:hypothetical protein